MAVQGIWQSGDFFFASKSGVCYQRISADERERIIGMLLEYDKHMVAHPFSLLPQWCVKELYIFIYIHTRVCMYIYTCICVCMCIYVYIDTCIHVYMCAHVHMFIYIYVYIYIYIYLYIFVYKHTYIRM